MESYFEEKFDKFLSHIRTILVQKKATAELLKALEININDFERIINLDVYGKRFVRYLILKLDLLYRGNSVQFNPPATISIEHILPQNPSVGSGWMNDFTEEERYEWTDKIGNLALISRRKNASQGNLDFADKMKKYLKEILKYCDKYLELLSGHDMNGLIRSGEMM